VIVVSKNIQAMVPALDVVIYGYTATIGADFRHYPHRVCQNMLLT